MKYRRILALMWALLMLLPSTALAVGTPTHIDDLNGRPIGVQTGSIFDQMLKQRLPKSQLYYFDGYTDLLMALTTRKVDAFPADEPAVRYAMSQDDRLDYLDEYLQTFEMAFAFPRSESGRALQDQFNDFLSGLSADGTLEALQHKWFDGDEALRTLPDYTALPATHGTLSLATEGGYPPFTYVKDGRTVGYDIELAARFCQARGYALDVVVLAGSAIIPSLSFGKYDFSGSGITVTPERAEQVGFSDPVYVGGSVFAVLRSSASTAPAGFWSGLQNSFRRTFLVEDRWRLFLAGTCNTLLITLLSLLLGTLAGFAIYLPCRNGSRLANGIAGACLWLVQGMPMVVLLMILYYIVFSRVALSGLIVAVLGFTLTFGGGVFSLLRMGVGAVDPGQYEAACALGYPNRRAFFRIILPQALPHVMPAYCGEVVSLIKATAIVGYIAVQDLTKMGDIVRSRTFEAFFPLIAVTVIYFLLEALARLVLGRLTRRIDPRRRTPEAVLKGIDPKSNL